MNMSHSFEHPAPSHGEQVALEVVVLIAGLEGTSGIEVAGGFLLDHVDDVIDGDDAHQPLFPVHHGNGQEVVALDDPRHLLLVGVGGHVDHLPGHHLPEPLGRIGGDQIP